MNNSRAAERMRMTYAGIWISNPPNSRTNRERHRAAIAAASARRTHKGADDSSARKCRFLHSYAPQHQQAKSGKGNWPGQHRVHRDRAAGDLSSDRDVVGM